MRVLFIHGFGGEDGGAMEQALAQYATTSGHRLHPFRWKSGNLQSMMTGSLKDIVREALSDVNPLRVSARILLAIQEHAGGHWENALVHILEAHLALLMTIRQYGKSQEPFSIIAFSLGARVTLLALQKIKRDLQSLKRVVFAGAAAPRSAFGLIPQALRCNHPDRVINIYSDGDYVLRGIYPFVHGCGDCAGIKPVKEVGVKNIRVDSGHLSYPELAHLLLNCAVSTQ
jgi:pimeloyl-ACP methyl ester carboxylesterase